MMAKSVAQRHYHWALRHFSRSVSITPPKEIIVTQDLRDNTAFQLESVSSGMVFVHPTD